jgi:hypothetical protein
MSWRASAFIVFATGNWRQWDTKARARVLLAYYQLQ